MVNNSVETITPLDSFTVYESRGFKKRVLWNVNLTETQAEFSSQEDERTIVVLREAAREQIKFMQTGLMFSESTLATVSGKANLDFGKNKASLINWLPPLSEADMQKDLRSMGIGMLIIGALSLILSSILDPIWGIILIGLGILNLIIKNRMMYIVNGVALIAVGLLNIITIVYSSTPLWILFGVMQIIWGVSEIKKFGQVKS